jgi:hypothetical protein
MASSVSALHGAALARAMASNRSAFATSASDSSSSSSNKTSGFGYRRRRPSTSAPRRAVARPRAMASDGGDDEGFLSKINPFKAVAKAKEKSAIAKREADKNSIINDDLRKQLFGDGLLGKVAAGVINNAAGALKNQMAESMEASQEAYDAATRAVRMDAATRERLGGDMTFTPPMSQMSSSMNVNGVTRQSVQIGFIAQSARGDGRSASCNATGVSDGSAGGRMEVEVDVRFDDGGLIKVAGGGGGDFGGGAAGDVEVLSGGGDGGGSSRASSYGGSSSASSAVIDVDVETIDVDVDDVEDK